MQTQKVESGSKCLLPPLFPGAWAASTKVGTPKLLQCETIDDTGNVRVGLDDMASKMTSFTGTEEDTKDETREFKVAPLRRAG